MTARHKYEKWISNEPPERVYLDDEAAERKLAKAFNRTNLIYWLENECVYIDDNGGKYLDSSAQAGVYYLYMRDRQGSNFYYTIQIRGNYIYLYRESWQQGGENINTFMSVTLPSVCGQVIAKTELVRETLIKLPVGEYEKFPALFKKNATTLF